VTLLAILAIILAVVGVVFIVRGALIIGLIPLVLAIVLFFGPGFGDG
jgi:hypothetical protein